MLTINQIEKYFRDFAQSHLQIGDFGYGDLWEISQSQSSEYCLMWVVPVPTELSEKQVGYRYTIVVCDREYKGLENRIEVESDTHQICLDIIAWLDKRQSLWELEHSATITPFKEKFKDEVNGWMFDVILRAPLTYDACQIPSAGTPPTPPILCEPALVEINGEAFGMVPSGSFINVPVQYENGTEVGEIEDGIVRIPDPIVCEPVEVTVNGEFFDSVTSGSSVDVPVKTQTGNPVGTLIGGEQIIPDVNILLNSNLVDTESPGSTANILIENTASEAVGTIDGGGHMTVGDSQITINTIPVILVPAQQAAQLIVKDTNNNQVGSLVGSDWVVPASATPLGIAYDPPVAIRQYTAYDTGSLDDGGRVQAGFYNYSRPVYPVSHAEIDYSVGATYHFRLKSNNVFGNKFRFTDIDGNQTFPATGNKNAVFIDHLTGYMWLRNIGAGAIPRSGARNWQSWMTVVDAFSVTVNGNVYSDWFMPGTLEAISIFGNFGTTVNMVDGSAIILAALQGAMPLSTTVIVSTSNFYTVQTDATIALRDKATNGFTTDCLAFRKHLW